MSNITNLNRDYLIKINVKEATIDVPKMTFWNTDKKTSNMFVQLVINMSENELIKNYVTIENATDYKITLNVIKPKTNQYRTFEAKLLNEEKALFEIDLTSEFIDQVGNYNFEFEVSSKVDNNDESITTSSSTYEVKGSILTNLNKEISSSPDLPILKQLIEQVKSLQGGDLTGYQKKSDNSLETTSKEIVGAINEVNSQYKDIANELGRDSEGNPINMGTTATDIRSAIKELKDNQGNSGDGSSYTLPIATSTTLGGVKPITKTDKMTQEVGVDAEGKLYTTPIASGDSGETEDVLKGTLPYTVNENGLYLLSDKNATISTGSGTIDLINFNDNSTIECRVKDYPTYCGNESYNILSDNSVSITRTIANKNCCLYLTIKKLKPNTTYTLVAKMISNNPKDYVRIGSSYQINFGKSDNYYFKTFLTDNNQSSVDGMIVFTGGDVGTINKYELHIFEGELTEMPTGSSFDIIANTQYNLDGYLGSTLTCTTTDVTVNVYKNNFINNDKGIIVFGDSIFALSSVASKLSKLIGKTVLDCSVGGARLTCTRDSSNDFYPYDMTQIADAIESDDYSTQIAKGKNKNFTTLSTTNINNYGTIILEFGTNDFANKASFSGTEKATVEGALKYILTKIQTKYPKLRIIVLSTMQFVAIGNGSESGIPTHNDGTVWQMNEVIKNVCESADYCVPFIDIYHKMQQNVTTRSTVTRDGVHLMSPTGEERYANLLNGQLKALGI